MSVVAQRVSPVVILWGTVALATAAGMCNALAAISRADPDRFQPEGILQHGLLLLAITAAASVSAVLGKRLLNRPTAALLGAVGGGLTASLVSPLLGALSGFLIGLLISLHWGRTALRLGVAFLLGLIGVGLARRIFLDTGSLWCWASILVLLPAVSLQLLVCRGKQQDVRTFTGRRPWYAVGSAIAYLLVVLVTLGCSWVGGWCAELLLRMDGIEQRGGRIHLVWRGRPLWSRAFSPVATKATLRNPSAGDWTTIRALPTVTGLTITGAQADDESMAEMPSLPSVWHLFIHNSNVSGSFLAAGKLPGLGLISVADSPFNDAAVGHMGQIPGLMNLYLSKTEVTGYGLARLRGLPLTTLGLSGERLVDQDLQGLGNLPITSLQLDCPNIRGEGLMHLASLSRLTTLNVDSPIEPESLRHIQAMVSLVNLRVRLRELNSETAQYLLQVPNRVKFEVHVPDEYAAQLASLDRRVPNARFYTYTAPARPAR